MQAAVFSTRQYEREAKRLLTEAEVFEMESSIAADPEAHPVIIGTGGYPQSPLGAAGRGQKRWRPSSLLLLER
jgi:hypothetical protein